MHINPILFSAIIVFAAALLVLLGAYEYREHQKAVDAALQDFKDHADRVRESIRADAARVSATVASAHSAVTRAADDIGKAAADVKNAMKSPQ